MSHRCLWNRKHPPREKKRRGKTRLQSANSGAGEQSLPPGLQGKGRRKTLREMHFITDTGITGWPLDRSSKGGLAKGGFGVNLRMKRA